MVIQLNQKLSRRGRSIYKDNPFLSDAASETKIGVKKISSKLGSNLMVVNSEGDSTYAGFWHTQEVDKTAFIKLYVAGVKAFKELTGAGTKVFEVLYLQMQDQIGRDMVYMSYSDVDQAVSPMSQMTYSRGINELLDKSFIAEAASNGRFFINPSYMFNGDRLQIVKEYKLNKYKPSKDQIMRQELEERGQQKLDVGVDE